MSTHTVCQVHGRGGYPLAAPARALRFWAFAVAASLLGFVLVSAVFDARNPDVHINLISPKKAEVVVKTPVPLASPVPTPNLPEPVVP